MIQPIQAKGLSALLLTTGLLVLVAHLMSHLFPPASFWFLGWSALQSAVAFLLFTWAVRISDKAFYSVFFADAALRLISLAVAIYLLHSWNVPYTVPLLTLALGYLVLSLVQIPFLMPGPLATANEAAS